MDSKPTYVVLGAAGGIGSELCRRLLASGVDGGLGTVRTRGKS